MPGSSLWLTPAPSHPLHGILTELIETTVPALLRPSSRPDKFAPHLTLTSNIDPAVYGADPQAWLDSLSFAAAATTTVVFERVKSEDVFFRRCYLKCRFTDGVGRLAGVARAWGVHGGDGPKTEAWLQEWKEAFGPHVSLVYGDVPIDDDKLAEVDKAVREAGIRLLRESEPITSGDLTGWDGGVVWLVPTDKSIPEWKPIATRTL